MELNGDSGSGRNEELTESVLNMFEAMIHRLKHDSSLIHGETQLGSAQVMVLFILYRRTCCKATDISEFIGITSGAVTAVADKLEKLGLIRRERSEEDRRLVLLSLTDKGLQTVKCIRKHRFDLLKHRLRCLSHEELEYMTRVFDKITKQIDEDTMKPQ